MKKMIQKHFPADVSMDYKTFLNDNKIDGALYAYFQTISKPIPVENKIFETRVLKKDLPTQVEICKKINIKSPKTYRNHLRYLLSQGYIVDKGDYYLLPWIGSVYFSIPLQTLFYFRDVLKEDVIKTYIYLGQRFKWKQNMGQLYVFTKSEIVQHLGLCINTDNIATITRILTCLYNEGFINFVKFSDGKTQKYRLTVFNLEYQKKQGEQV